MKDLYIKGVICDLDGSLLDSMWVWDEVDRVFLDRRGFEVPTDYARTIAPMGFDKAADYTITLFDLKEDKQAILKEWFDLAHHFFKEKVALKKGARAWLDSLKEKGMRLCIATSSDPYLYEDALVSLDIRDYFEFCLDPRWASFDKTKPLVYTECAKRMGLSTKECVVLEDIPSALRSAKEAGCRTIGIYDEHFYGKEMLSPFADVLIDDLRDKRIYREEIFR